MNSSIIMEIIHNYNKIPYYKYNEYISIKDDRVGRIVSFKIYQNTTFDDVFKAACDYWFKRLERYKKAKIKEDKYFNKHGCLPKGFK